MASYPRAELEAMVERWLEANRRAEQAGDWKTYLGPLYTEDAVYGWNVGPEEDFVARGRKEIEELAIGYQMKGFEDWRYPYHDIIIDEKRGTVIGFWQQVAPATRPDGKSYTIPGIGGSWFEYGGNFQWRWQRDFFDFGNAKATFFELAGAGLLNDTIKQKIHRQARGELLPGHERIRPRLSAWQKTRNAVSILSIALVGR